MFFCPCRVGGGAKMTALWLLAFLTLTAVHSCPVIDIQIAIPDCIPPPLSPSYIPPVFVSNSLYTGGYIDPDVLLPEFTSTAVELLAIDEVFTLRCTTTCADVSTPLTMYTYTPGELDWTDFDRNNSVFCFDAGVYTLNSSSPDLNSNQFWIGCPGSSLVGEDQTISAMSVQNITIRGITFDGIILFSFTNVTNFIMSNCSVLGTGELSMPAYFDFQGGDGFLIYDNYFYRLGSSGGGSGRALQFFAANTAIIHNNLFVSVAQAIVFGEFGFEILSNNGPLYFFNNTYILNEDVGPVTVVDLSDSVHFVYIQNNAMYTTIPFSAWLVANIVNVTFQCPINGTGGTAFPIYVTNNTVVGFYGSDLSPMAGAIFKNNTFQSTQYIFEIGDTSACAFVNNTFYECLNYFSNEGNNPVNGVCPGPTSYCAFRKGFYYTNLNTFLNYEITDHGTYNVIGAPEAPCNCTVYGGSDVCCSAFNEIGGCV